MGTVPPPPELPPEAPPAEEAPAEPVAETPPRPRRGRLPMLLASAALLGVVAGVATGYTVQAARKPTALPPLSQHTLKYPKKRLSADDVQPLAAKHDHRVKTDGDLRELLVPKPKGTQTSKTFGSQDGWVPLIRYARGYESPDGVFTSLARKNFRRAARRAWQGDGNREVIVDLVQFRDQSTRDSNDWVIGQRSYMSDDAEAGNEGSPLEGSGNGRYWVYDQPHRKPGYLPLYAARALAERGDIVMDINILDTKPISEKTIRTLAEKQLERL